MRNEPPLLIEKKSEDLFPNMTSASKGEEATKNVPSSSFFSSHLTFIDHRDY